MKKFLTLIMFFSLTTQVSAAEGGFFQNIMDEASALGSKTLGYIKPSEKKEVSPADDEVFQEVWSDFTKVTSEAIDLATKSDRDDRTMLELLTAREPKYIRLLKKAQDILSDSAARKEFDTIYELQLENKKLAQESVELKRDRIAAPLESKNPFVKSRATLDRRIAEIPDEIAENDRRIEVLQMEILTILNKSGIDITSEELKYFLVAAEGSEILRLMRIADNMKKMQLIIGKELEVEKDNVDLAKIYTGMYLISLEAYATAHDTAIANMEVYREKIKFVSKEADINLREAKTLRRNASQPETVNLDANIAINERTIYVANLYDDLLQRRMRHLEKSKAAVENKVKLARNTYRTIVNGSSLIKLIDSGSSEYALLVDFDMPELRTIYDAGMLKAFTEISEQIKMER